MTKVADDSPVKRGPGRPRRVIGMEDVANAAANLFAQGGYDAVSIEAVAERLAVSRATLYRTVPTKEHLLGIVLEWYTTDLGRRAKEFLDSEPDSRAALTGLLRIQVDAAIRTKDYFAVLAGGGGVQSDTYHRWQAWSREYEALWRSAVERAIEAKVLAPADPVVTTRLLLGMAIWVSRWFRDTEGYSAEDVSDAAVNLIFSSIQ